jgi:hypothetical protein
MQNSNGRSVKSADRGLQLVDQEAVGLMEHGVWRPLRGLVSKEGDEAFG